MRPYYLLLNFSENTGIKAVGIKWNISSDSFTFTVPDVELKDKFDWDDILKIP